MHMTNEEYQEFVKRRAPKSPVLGDVVKAFLVGGLICCGGQALLEAFTGPAGLSEDAAATWVSITLVLLSALLTGLNVYDKLARFAGAGTLVPITGFANAVVSPALEFKTEGFVLGTAAKMFTIAGPVIAFGLASSVVYGLVLCLIG